MLMQNIKLAFRAFRKNRSITAINILGLAVGICAALVIFLIIQYDYSFDKWEPKKDLTYRVVTETRPGEARAAVPIPAQSAIKSLIPGIQTVAYYVDEPFYRPHITVPNSSVSKEATHTNIEGVVFADQNYFTVFPHHWIVGNAASLNNLNNIVLTKSTAANFFPGASPAAIIGQILIIQDSLQFTVSGIVSDLNQKTDFNSTIFLSLPTLLNTSLINAVLMPAEWYNLNGNSKCIVQLRPGVSPGKINQQLAALFKSHPFNIADIKSYSARLQPLSDVHFNIDLDGKISKTALLQLALLAILLILLAVINYVNLATAMATTRAKEIGVRKTFGGSKKQLYCQFLTETTIMTCLATALALVFVPFTLQAFRSFLPEGLRLSTIFNPMFLPFIVILIAVVSILSGFYPAYTSTKWRPAIILKSQPFLDRNPKKGTFRQILTVCQFVVAQVFLITVVLMGKQIRFVVNHDLGFNKDAIINFTLPSAEQTSLSKKQDFVHKLQQIPGVQQVSLSSAPPIRNGYSEAALTWKKNGIAKRYNHIQFRMIDTSYLSTYNLQLIAGKNIYIDTTNAWPELLINEAMMHHMGYTDPQDVIGTEMTGFYENNSIIVGVLKNFNTQSLHYTIQPAVLFADNLNNSAVVSLKLAGYNPAAWQQVLTRTNTLFKSFYPNDVFKSNFFDEAIDRLYATDVHLSRLLNWVTGLAIFISLLGLLGLVSFMANRRTKEIGIRKVLGATTTQIILLFSRGLLKLVFIAALIAAPIAWYLSRKWLEDFAYKTSLSWWIFGISMAGMLFIAMAVLWLKTNRTARLNPAISLKNE